MGNYDMISAISEVYTLVPHHVDKSLFDLFVGRDGVSVKTPGAWSCKSRLAIGRASSRKTLAPIMVINE